MRRVHRTVFERLGYMAKYQCRGCNHAEAIPRPYRYHLGNRCRCPRCGTYRITKLKVRDKIDPMQGGFLNLVEKWAGGELYHCRFCRIQFWDRRAFTPYVAPAVNATPDSATPAEDREPAPKTKTARSEA
jgi:hypothetical protein